VLTLSAATPAGGVETIATPGLWAVTIGAVIALLVLDFVITRKPHEVSMRRRWLVDLLRRPARSPSGVYSGPASARRSAEFYTGYLVEKSLSVDNLFVFMLLLTAFAVPAALQQRVLLYGIVGALVLRGIFIALGAAALDRLSFAFLLFGAILLVHRREDPADARKGTDHVRRRGRDALGAAAASASCR
jgi:hypothetical protein